MWGSCIWVVAITAVAASITRGGDQFGGPPQPNPCVRWTAITSNTTIHNVSDVITSADDVYVVTSSFTNQCLYHGEVIPCLAVDPGTGVWGHTDHRDRYPQMTADACHTWINGSNYDSDLMYVPVLGARYKKLVWTSLVKGDAVPSRAVTAGPFVLARSPTNYPDPGGCNGQGFTGWARVEPNNTLDSLHFTVNGVAAQKEHMEVAVCDSDDRPFIRFGHTVPTDQTLTVTITQGSSSFTWQNYAFGQFSGWVQDFENGQGTIDVYDSQGTLLLSTVIPLTPGPLVVVVKDTWPPHNSSNVDTIAASYVPTIVGSGVRLFNLSPDTFMASMSSGGSTLASNIEYGLGSGWYQVPSGVSMPFTATDALTGATLATDSFVPPNAPYVFTNFLIGLSNSTAFPPRLVPLVDAPELSYFPQL
jgi:hypothetical protein